MQWIVFGEDWASHPSSTQHLFSHIADSDEVIWINSMGLRSPEFNRHDITRAARKVSRMLTRRSDWPDTRSASDAHAISDTENDASSEASGLHKTQNDALKSQKKGPDTVIEPRTLPVYQSKLVREYNKWQLQKQLAPYLADKTEPRILWLSLPSAVDMVGCCDEDLSVYYCGDDFASLAGVDHDIVSRMEAELAERCDLILTASEKLTEKFPMGKTHVLEHGVDYDLFSRPQTRPAQMPESGPNIGFYGQLADWVDIGLLSQIADQFSHCNLILIGAIHTDTQTLLQKPNVFWLDAMAHHKLAGFCQHWDVAILPFHQCEQITHCNPLKLREYLASGTSVVSTRFPAAEKYADVMTLVDHPSMFIQALHDCLEQALTDDALQQRIQQQRASVKNESWQARADQVRYLIAQGLQTDKSAELSGRTFVSNTSVSDSPSVSGNTAATDFSAISAELSPEMPPVKPICGQGTK